MRDNRRSAWLLRSVNSLNTSGSRTGRTHVQKHLFLAGELLSANHPFEFALYKFGPYSFDVDSLMRELMSVGILGTEELGESYGPMYSVAEPELDSLLQGLDLDKPDVDALELMADAIGDCTSSDLEVIATCQWARSRDRLSDRDAIVRRVHVLKPKYTPEFIQRQYEALIEIEESLK